MIDSTLVVDPERPRIQRPRSRQPVEVAVGVLIRPDGMFLLTSRPPGKAYCGYWEFPGGKLEVGEDVQQALRRELHEELGILIELVEPWMVTLVDYPHALVNLNFYRVFSWTGNLQMREGQSYSWQTLPVRVTPVLPGTVPVLRWLAEEQGFVGETHDTPATPQVG